MKTPLLIINGVTNSGKTTAMEYTLNNCEVNGSKFLYLHPIARLKRFLEQQYQCPDLDTKEGKNYIPPGSPSSMQEIMVGMWNLFVRDGLDPMFSQRMLIRDLEGVPDDTPLVFNAIRNLGEVEFLINLAKSRTMDLFFIRLRPPLDVTYNAPSSDANEQNVAMALFKATKNSVIVDNSFNDEFFQCLSYVLDKWFS